MQIDELDLSKIDNLDSATLYAQTLVTAAFSGNTDALKQLGMSVFCLIAAYKQGCKSAIELELALSKISGKPSIFMNETRH